jgi:FMN phosphatase YigB (HAD superfamily)
MTYTLLFELDDTLLDTNIESILPTYFQALSDHLAPYVSSSVLLPSLSSATQAMIEHNDPSRTKQDVFERDFYTRIGIPKEDLIEVIDEFYNDVFPKLSVSINPRPDAVPSVEWAVSQGHRVAIATDPLFPRKAIYLLLKWAGFDPDQFEFISTSENSHFNRTHVAYYAEMLGRLGWLAGPVLMVGNDVQRDLIPADRLGLKTYFINDESDSSPGFETGRGNFADLRPWLESQNPSDLEPSFKSPDAILAIMTSTPAIMLGLTSSLTDEQWQREVTRDEWALNEIICHLRDTEIEVHKVQLQLMIEKAGAFIPRPESSIWANERKYQNAIGTAALVEFSVARMQNIDAIRKLDASIWSRKARHAIFGPTNFLEVMGFITDHDRAHIQQGWNTLKSVQAERV